MKREMDAKRAAISSRLRLAREQAGLTQGQVAKKLRLQRPTISEIEAGRRRVTAEELSMLASIYGVGVSWLACEGDAAIDASADRIELAARQLSKLKPEDKKRLLGILTALMKSEESRS
jgi:transcriptional regulator with XRE-family HTH domain